MSQVPKILHPSNICDDSQSLLLIEIGKKAKGKATQLRKKRQSLSPYYEINSGVFYFNSEPYVKRLYNPEAPDFFAQYKSIPEKLLSVDYLVDIDNSGYKIPQFIENCIINNDSEKLYHMLQNYPDSKFSNTFGRLCELIVFEDLNKFKQGNMIINELLDFQNEIYSGPTEIDVIVSGQKKLYREFMNFLKRKDHINIVRKK